MEFKKLLDKTTKPKADAFILSVASGSPYQIDGIASTINGEIKFAM